MATNQTPTPESPAGAGTRRRLPRADRREQIVAAATRAFCAGGFTATSLDDVASAAGVSRVIIYRHFDSKADLYRAALEAARTRCVDYVGTGEFTMESLDAFVQVAAADPDGFRLLFHQAAREPEFQEEMEAFGADAEAAAYRQLVEVVPDRTWAQWAARLAPRVAIDAIVAWLDAGQPDPDQAAQRVGRAVAGIVDAARFADHDR